MQRDLVRRTGVPPGDDSLATPHWRHLSGVRSPADAEGVIDEIVVGPSGVHVRLHLGGVEVVWAGSPGLAARAEQAQAAADAVAAVLPLRYRHSVRAHVCACDAEESGVALGTVEVLSPTAGRHAMQHAPRLLSTSEVAEVAGVLDVRLEVLPPVSEGVARSRRVLWWLAGAAATAAIAAAVLTEAVGRTPWS
jgi:hypothetical protein